MVDLRPMEEEIRGVEVRNVGTETYEGPTEPVLQTQKTPSFSSTFIKENIDVLRTMIKSMTSKPRQKLCQEDLHMLTLIKKLRREPAHLRRSRRLEDRSITKEKTRRERSKSRGKRSGRQERSSDSEYEEGSEGTCEELNSPYKRPKLTPYTQRITRFKYHRRAKLPRNIRVYEGNKDLKDQLGIILTAAEQEEWPMPVCCQMFCQTLGGAARNWFDDLDPKSVDSFEELSQKILDEFSQQKRYAKDPIEIYGIKRRKNEAQQQNTQDGGRVERVRAFIKGEVVAGLAEMVRPSQWDKGNVRLAWSGGPEKARNRVGPKETRRNMGIYTPYPRKDTFTLLIKTPKEILAMEKRQRPQHQRLLLVKKADRRSCGLGEVGPSGEGNPPEQPEEREFLKINVPPFRNNRPLSNYRKGRKEQNGANGICNSKMSFVQRHNRKDRNEKPHSEYILIRSRGRNVPWPYGDKGRSKSRPRKSVDNHLNPHPEKSKPNTKFIPATDRCWQIYLKTYRAQEGEELMLCLRKRNETVSSILMVEREGVQTPVSYVSRPLQGMEICYNPTEKMVQALIHTTRSLRTTFRKHKVTVMTDGPMDKLSGREGRLVTRAAKIRTYDISYIQRKEVEGSVVKKFFGQGEQVQKTPDANEGETSNLSKKLQAKLTPTPRAWRLYLGKEAIEEGSGIGIILVCPDEKMHSYAIRLKFNASDHAMDCEALLVGLVASASKGMKDLHVFIDSLTLVSQIERNHTPATKQERKYNEEIMDATTPFHRFRITHLPKILNSKTEVLTGLATIKLEFLNQEVSVGIKTRPSVEVERAAPKESMWGHMALPLREQRYPFLRVKVFDFGGLPNLMVEGLSGRMLMEHKFGQAILDLDMPGALQFQLGRARRHMSWRHFILALGLHTDEEMQTAGFGISSARDFLGTAPSYTAIRDLILRLCHRLIACSIAGRSQAPKKMTVTDLFYLRGMDVDSVNFPYLLARYLRLFAARRKSRAHIFGGQFMARLAEHFGLLTAEILGGLTVIAPELPIIDMAELVRLQICKQLDDTWAWVAMGPDRQPDATAGAPRVAQDAPIVDEGGQADPAPVQAVPPLPPVAARTMPQRMARLEEDVHEIRWTLAEQREVLVRWLRIFPDSVHGLPLASHG
ncbi:reverse transcriptase domain-containing protein [Tanacetum coccineum]